jgi:hypothetical protein
MYQNDLWTRLKAEPALFYNAVASLLYLAVGFGLPFTDDNTGTVLALVAAALNVVLAWSVSKFSWPLLQAVVQAAIACAVSFGLDWSSEQQSLLLTATSMLGALLVRRNVTPVLKQPAVDLAA